MDMDKTALGVVDVDEQAQAIPAPASNATQMAIKIECPVCRTSNPPSETYCIDCGFLLSGSPFTVASVSSDGASGGAAQLGKLVTPDGTREFTLKAGANTVGRESADVLLMHNTVSRMHATVTIEDGKALAEDAGSTNGTYVDGKKLGPEEKIELTDGCDVVFGSFSLRYEAPVESEEQGVESEEPVETNESEAVTDFIVEPAEQQLADESAAVEEPAEAQQPAEASIVGRLVAKDGTVSLGICDGINTIGRREGDNDIVVPDPYCSGRHADLAFEDGRFTITDIGSTNGTLVNGVKLDADAPRELTDGDEITLGRMAFVLEVA